ncbi:MAG: D-cysteine desulfhydrase family protein [Desulfurococcaceae archaeon]|nr:D-cysteine desulfhydrase family protein [Desulfurococcaceae archaeon]
MIWRVLEYPRFRLVDLPTPIERAVNLSRELGIELYVKRDDVMGLALGGNKARKLEFVLADALSRGCDVVVTRGATHSNHVRLTAAAARRAGLDFYAVVTPPGKPLVQGNILLDLVLGARLLYVDSVEEAERAVDKLVEELKSKGRRPCVIPPGAACELGVLGYVLAALEIVEQCYEYGYKPKYVVHASGTGATQAGLLLGFKLLGVEGVEVIGVSDGVSAKVLAERVSRLFNATARMLQVEYRLEPEDVSVYEDPGLGGYGTVSREVVEAILLAARLEGLLLDPVYTGRALHGLVKLVESGVIEKGSQVVFIHTGGVPVLFHYAEEIAKYLESRGEAVTSLKRVL